MVKVVPLPSSLSKAIVLFCASIKRLQTANPKPCPLAFVVKRGLNIFALASFGMPLPVSCTLNRILPTFAIADMVIFPPFDMAWTLLVIRFVTVRLR